MAMDIVGPQCNLHILHPAVCTKGIKLKHCIVMHPIYIAMLPSVYIHVLIALKLKHGNIGNKMH